MATLLLRVSRRKTAWEPETGAEETYRVEFTDRDGTPDLSPSVYEIEDQQEDIVRAYAEHYAGLGLDPPRGATNVDFGGEHDVAQTPGDSDFEFTRDAHREVRFKTEEALKKFVELVCSEIETRKRPTTKAEVKNYVKSRLDEDDAAWCSHCENFPKWGKKASG